MPSPESRPWWRPPPDWVRTPGWTLLPLRLFLGATFTFAGLQKLADPSFFSADAPGSIRSQLIGSVRTSPVHELLGHLLRFSTPLGVTIALGEIAVGTGILLGLWTRLAALGGMAIAFSLFLTVSFHASPYYTGADIVFVFACTPLLLAGAGGAPALDTWRAARRGEAPDDAGGDRRRALLLTGGVAALVVLVTGLVTGIGRLLHGSGGTSAATPVLGGTSTTPGSAATTTTGPAAGPTTTTGATGGTTPPGTAIGKVSEIPVGGAGTFTDPASGQPGLAIRSAADTVVAFDAVCPHAGCTVGYSRSNQLIVCPCHGSEFDASTGAVVQGPATRGLRVIPAAVAGGQLYVDT